MENASKALVMAGGILISMLVIGLLVFFFNNLSELQNIKQSDSEVEAITEFNKQYDVYARNVYGSELLSIANKIRDYNKREGNLKGYEEIELYIQIESDLDKKFFKKGIYTSTTIDTEVEKLKNEIEEIGKTSIQSSTNTRVSRKISQLSTMRTKDIEELGILYSSYNVKLNQYNTYKTLLTEIKAKEFKYVNFEYSKYNGRIIKMTYKL